jgi:hypothetical protein
MRIFTPPPLAVGTAVAVVAILSSACSTSSSGAAQPDGGADAGPGLTCTPATLVLAGPSTKTPHGSYAMSNVLLNASSFSATLPAGGSVALSWIGDATQAAVAVGGEIVIPPDDEGTPSTWCVDGGSTVKVSGSSGTLNLLIALQGAGGCGSADAGSALTASGCFDGSS